MIQLKSTYSNEGEIMERLISKFGLDIVDLISKGKKETVSIIEEKIDDGNLIDFLSNQYNLNFSYDERDAEKLKKTFDLAYTHGDSERKFMINNPDDGLLLVIAIIFN
jgi:hypothetical protein